MFPVHKCDSTLHTLSNCSVQLKQGIYNWRHDNIVRYIYNSLDRVKYEAFADIEGCKTTNGKTIPVHIHPTNDRPDIVVIDENKKIFNTFELTVPYDTNIDKRNTDKNNKYAYLLTDVTNYKPNVMAFEISVRGHITKDNKTRLKKIHSYCKQEIKLKTFIENISALAITSSYVLFNGRKDALWSETTPTLEPYL